jgi:methylmalonyl-CoA mutase
MAVETLLDEFLPVSTDAWEDAIRKDLKGADYARRLVWKTDEGIAVKPYYRAEDCSGLELPAAAPGNFPYVRGTQSTSGWRICEEIDAIDPESANGAAMSALAAGAEKIVFRYVAIENSSDLKILLANLQKVPMHFENAGELLLRLLVDRAKQRDVSATISTGWNPFENLEFATELLAAMPTALVPYTIHGERYEESGATTIEEIGFTLAAAVDFMDSMQERGLEIDRVCASLGFSFAIGANYFFQIAKLRAFRMLWAQIVDSFGGALESAKARIHARTSCWNKTIYDPHVNILRATTEAMSAILGGADSVYVAPFDECYRVPEDASRRLARNTQLVLRHEAFLDRVSDPAGGSYYIEFLTDSIARESWKTIQGIESAGGFCKAAKAGLIAKALDRSKTAKAVAIASRRSVFTGTNRFANAPETALDRIDPQCMAGQQRAANAFEVLRLRTEQHRLLTGAAPRVLMAEIGDAKMRAARSGFASDFFACAGFDIAIEHFDVPEDIAQRDADLIVLCSSDAEYSQLGAEMLSALKARGRETPVLIAGEPEGAEELLSAGIADFVSRRSNPIELLTKWQLYLGIKE